MIGGDVLVCVQLMMNIDMVDVIGMVIQIKEFVNVGFELVCIMVNMFEVVVVVLVICEQFDWMGVIVLFVGDFYYNGYLLLCDYLGCVELLLKYWINFGNVGQGVKCDMQFVQMIEVVVKYDKLVWIGVNWGSFDQDLFVCMMDENGVWVQLWDVQSVMYEVLIQLVIGLVECVVEFGLGCDCIVLLCKVSGVQDLIVVYCEFGCCCGFVLYFGLIEVGMGLKGIVVLMVVFGVLLQEGIGDMICILLMLELGVLCMGEVIVGQEIFQMMGLCLFVLMVIVCLGCGCMMSMLFQEFVMQIQIYLCEQMLVWCKEYLGVEKMNVVVMGCIVNGLGELKYVNIGISLLGLGENLVVFVFIDGEKVKMLCGEWIVEEFQQIVSDYVVCNYGCIEVLN